MRLTAALAAMVAVAVVASDWMPTAPPMALLRVTVNTSAFSMALSTTVCRVICWVAAPPMAKVRLPVVAPLKSAAAASSVLVSLSVPKAQSTVTLPESGGLRRVTVNTAAAPSETLLGSGAAMDNCGSSSMMVRVAGLKLRVSVSAGMMVLRVRIMNSGQSATDPQIKLLKSLRVKVTVLSPPYALSSVGVTRIKARMGWPRLTPTSRN